MSDQLPALAREPVPSLHPMIEVALRDPNIDVAKLRALMEMQKEVRADWAREEFGRAMAACQAEIQPIVKDSENQSTKSFYAKLERVDRAVRPIYARYGFAISYTEEIVGDGSMIVLVCAVTRDLHTEYYRMTGPPDTLGPKGTMNKTPLHGRASTNTLLRRYLLCMVFNIVLKGLDDDGQKGAYRPIDTQMVAELAALVSQTQMDVPTLLLRLFGEDVRSLEEIPMTHFALVKNGLLRKQREQQTAS